MGIVNRPRYQSPPAGCRDWAGLAHGVVYEGWIRSASEGQITALLIHGTASDRWTWEPLIEALPLGIGLLAIDLPGHGLTALPRGDGGALDTRRFQLDSLARDCIALLGQLSGVRSPIVVGHSAGAAVALAVAQETKALKGVVGLAPSLVPPPSTYSLMLAPLFNPLFTNPLSLRAMSLLCAVPGVLSSILDSMGGALSQEVRDHYRDLLSRPEHLAGAMHFMAEMNLPRLLEGAAWDLIPCRLLAAANDQWIPIEPLTKCIERSLPSAHLEILPEGGHLFHELDPARAAHIVEDLMA